MIFLQLLVVLAAIILGARLKGIGLGIMGGLGLLVLVFVFGNKPTSPPIDVMLMIIAVITAASAMQAAGGLDYLVSIATNILRKNPNRITFYGPLVTYFFSLIAGTGHIAYSILPVIAEVAKESKVRPERPLGISVIASQQAITASPISAATVALLGILSLTYPEIKLVDIMKISIPATLFGVIIGSVFSLRVGKDLMKDPEYLEKVKKGLLKEKISENKNIFSFKSKLSVIIFLIGVFSIVLFGAYPSMRPIWNGEEMNMSAIIQVLMLSIAAIIILSTKTDVDNAVKGNIFSGGMQAVIAIYGVAWMGDTFVHANIDFISSQIKSIVSSYVWLFSFALFIMSILLYSQSATVLSLIPLGVSLGLSPWVLIAMYPAVNGYFFIPNYPTLVAAINFDDTGTTRIGKYILNHSFMMPGLVSTIGAIAIGFLFLNIFN